MLQANVLSGGSAVDPVSGDGQTKKKGVVVGDAAGVVADASPTAEVMQGTDTNPSNSPDADGNACADSTPAQLPGAAPADTPGAGDIPGAGEVAAFASTVSLVRALHEDRLSAESLSAEDRQRCVDQLSQQGFSSSDISELMRISERTVRRDRAEIRRDHALEPDPHMGDQLLGEFARIVRSSVQRLVRLCNDPEAPAYARLWAEESIVRNYQRLIDTARKLNYFETGSQRLSDKRLADPDALQKARDRYKANHAMIRASVGLGGEDDMITKLQKKLWEKMKGG